MVSIDELLSGKLRKTTTIALYECTNFEQTIDDSFNIIFVPKPNSLKFLRKVECVKNPNDTFNLPAQNYEKMVDNSGQSIKIIVLAEIHPSGKYVYAGTIHGESEAGTGDRKGEICFYRNLGKLEKINFPLAR